LATLTARTSRLSITLRRVGRSGFLKLAAALVGSKPDVIFALGGDVTPHVAKATQTIPIIYAMSADPVLLGLAASLARPGGNSTGVTFLSDQLAAKRLETFREVAPRLSRVGVVRDPSHVDNEMPIAQRAAAGRKGDRIGSYAP